MTRLVTVALLSVASSQAFAPASMGSTFVQTSTPTRTAFVSPYNVAPRNTNMALQMNLLDRFTRVAKANINNVLKSLEDPEKILTQALEDMQTDLVKIRQSYAEITATQRRLLKQKEQSDALAQDWYQRAQLALQKGNEALAKEALTRRQQQLDAATNLQSQIDVQASSIDKLYEGMQMLESKIMEAKSKKEQMIARARTAQSTQKVNDMLGGITGRTSMDAFTRMEEKVEALEAAAEVSAEMGSLNGNLLPGSTSVEAEFKLLEGSSAVENELMKLKGLLNPASGGATTGSGASPGAVDDELERLKRDAGL